MSKTCSSRSLYVPQAVACWFAVGGRLSLQRAHSSLDPRGSSLTQTNTHTHSFPGCTKAYTSASQLSAHAFALQHGVDGNARRRSLPMSLHISFTYLIILYLRLTELVSTLQTEWKGKSKEGESHTSLNPKRTVPEDKAPSTSIPMSPQTTQTTSGSSLQTQQTAAAKEMHGHIQPESTPGSSGLGKMLKATAPLPSSAAPMSPRATRRQMLSSEYTDSLRRNILWERHVNKGKDTRRGHPSQPRGEGGTTQEQGSSRGGEREGDAEKVTDFNATGW